MVIPLEPQARSDRRRMATGGRVAGSIDGAAVRVAVEHDRGGDMSACEGDLVSAARQFITDVLAHVLVHDHTGDRAKGLFAHRIRIERILVVHRGEARGGDRHLGSMPNSTRLSNRFRVV